MNWLYIAVGGALGSMCRYGVSSWVQRSYAGHFPLGTFSVNIAGSLVIGLLYSLFSVNGILDERLRLLLFVGFLGGFTTFSSFTFENFGLIQSGSPGMALGYILASNLLGVLAAFAGYWIGTFLK